MVTVRLGRGLVWIALLCATALGCTAENKLQQAGDFQEFDTWWLGEQFEEFKLSRVDAAAFLYGDCEPASDSGCPPPVQLIMENLCDRPRLDIEPSDSEQPLRGGATFQRIRDGQALVRTGTVAITLFARDDATVRRMAEAMRSLNVEPPVASGEPMPAPTRCDDR